MNIITTKDFRSLRNITYKIDEGKVSMSITQAHTDLREVLGDAFYFDLVKNKDEAAYGDLLNGSEFNVDGNVYIHEGIKSLLADYSYARYLYEVNINHSPFGMVQKNSQDSEPIDRNMIKDLVKQVNQDASRKFELIRTYLDSKKDVFTVWAGQDDEDTDNSTGFNATRITFMNTNKRRYEDDYR